MTETHVTSLLDLLRTEVDLYGQLLQRQKGKLDLLLSRDLQKIEQGIAQEQQLLAAIAASEKQLKSLLLGQSLSEVIEEAEVPYRDSLNRLVEQFRKLIREISRVNTRNSRYIQRSLLFFQSWLHEVFGGNLKYDAQGRPYAEMNGVARKGLVVWS